MQQLMDGIFLGSIYALFAVGYTLVFGVLDRLNLAHAAVFSAGALVIGLAPSLATPRRATPRPRVPAGSVAIGAASTTMRTSPA